MKNKPSNHSTIRNPHPRSSKNLSGIYSKAQPLSLVPNPTRRYLKKLSLGYLYCPDCESKNITYYGKSSSEAQKHLCKECNYQFVAQFDAVFPQNKRRTIFEEEFLSNIKPTGFDKVGTGKKKYWVGERLTVLQMLESQVIRVRANKMIKDNPIRGDKDYKVLLEFLVHEAYGLVMT